MRLYCRFSKAEKLHGWSLEVDLSQFRDSIKIKHAHNRNWQSQNNGASKIKLSIDQS